MSDNQSLALLDGVTFIQITNPLDPREHTRVVVAHKPAGKLIDYLTVARGNCVVAVSGGLVDEADYYTRTINRGDTIVVCPIPQGGGGKNILRLVAIIAVAVFAPAAAGALTGIAAGATGAAGFALSAATAGITIAGTLLVNTLLPVTPSLPSNGAAFDDSPSYGIDGATNTSRGGLPVPVVYGTFRTGGNRIASFVENVDSQTQDYYAMYALSEGPIAGVGSVLINDEPIENFVDVETEVRTGELNQASLPNFSSAITSFEVAATLDTTFVQRTTNDPVDQFRVDLVFPQGLVRYSDRGDAEEIFVALEIQYRKQGDVTWINLPNNSNKFIGYQTFYYYTDVRPTQVLSALREGTYLGTDFRTRDTIYKTQSKGSVGYPVVCGYSRRQAVYQDVLSVTDKSRNPVRASFRSSVLPRAIYEVRVRRTTEESVSSTRLDRVVWGTLSEIIATPFQYPKTAILGVKIKLSDQLNQIPKVTSVVSGRMIRESILKGQPTNLSEAKGIFARASIGTYVDSLGDVVVAPSGEIRTTYHPITNELLGWMIERGRTNSALQSADFTQAAWAKSELTVSTDGAVMRPDGVLGAQKITPSTNNASHELSQIVAKSAAVQPWAASIWLKSAGYTKATLRMTANSGNGYQVAVDMTAGTLGTPTILGTGFTLPNVRIEPYKNGWYRVALYAFTNADPVTSIRVLPSDAAGNTVFAGNGTSGIYVWGAQLEQGTTGGASPYGTSYIPTTTATVARSDDTLRFDLGEVTDFDIAEGYTVMVETHHNPMYVGSVQVVVFGETNTSPDRFGIRLETDNTMMAQVFSGGVQVASQITANAATNFAFNRVALSLATNEFRIVLNGGAAAEDFDGGLPRPTNIIRIGAGYVNTPASQIIRRVVVYNTPMSATDLQEITTAGAGYDRTNLMAQYLPEDNVYARIGDPTDLYEWAKMATGNAAWVTYDMLTDTLYGAGISPSRIDLARWREWGEFCRDNNLNFNGVFDTQTNVWDAMQHVLKIGHAQLVNVGTRYTVAIERQDEPVMLFNVANVKENSFRTNWLPYSSRANDIDYSYYDEADNNKEVTIRVTNPDAPLDRVQRPLQIRGYGVTNQLQAQKEAVFQMNLNRLVRQTCSFEASIEAIACTVGDQILVQSDVTDWGYGGKTVGGTTTSVTLDREVTFLGGRTYRFLLNYGRVRKAAGKITSIVGNYIYLSGYAGEIPVKRLVTASRDLEVLSTVDGGVLGFGVQVSGTSGLSTGNAYELFDTDVIADVAATNPAGGAGSVVASVVNLSEPLPATPGRFQNWLLGDTTTQIKPWRVTAISGGAEEFTRTISAIDYKAEVYNLTTTLAPIDYRLPQLYSHVSNLSVFEELTLIGDVLRPILNLGWDMPAIGTYSGAKIFAAVNGAKFIEVGTVRHGLTTFDYESQAGKTVIFKVVAIDTLGRAMPTSTAPTITHLVLGKLAPPTTPTDFEAAVAEGGVKLTWTASPDRDIARYEIREGVDWESGVVVGRTDANFVQLGAVPAGSHTYHIKAIDTSSIYSLNAASTTIVLAGPSAVVFQTPTYQDGNITLTWSPAASALPVVEYEIRHGASYAGSTLIGKVKTTAFVTRVVWASRTFWVTPIDSAESVGPPASTVSTITLPVNSLLQSEVVDNNVLLRWNTALGTLPLKHHIVTKIASGITTTVGTSATSFSAIFESRSGTFTYEVTPVDTAGNMGTKTTVNAKVDEPPDFVFVNQFQSKFEGHKTNFYVEDGVMYGPFNGTETYDAHYSTRTWTNDADAIAAGYPYYGQPSPLTASIREVYDSGAVVPATRILAEANFEQVAGSTTLSYQLAYAQDNRIPSVAFNDFTNAHYSLSGIVITANTGNTVDGQPLADTIEDNSTTINGLIQQAATVPCVAGQVWAARIDVEKQSAGTTVGWLRLIFTGGTAVAVDARLNPDTGSLTVSVQAHNRSYVEDMGTHWRLTCTGTAQTGNTAVRWQWYPAVATRAAPNTSDVTLTGSLKCSNAHLIGPFIEAPVGDQAFGTNFRYVRLDTTATNSDDKGVYKVTKLQTTLKSKQKNDQGVATVAGTTAGGANGHKVTVTFTTTFVDVTSITATTQGTVPYVAIVNFVDAPNPTTFEIQVYDMAGVAVTGPVTVAWTARGN